MVPPERCYCTLRVPCFVHPFGWRYNLLLLAIVSGGTTSSGWSGDRAGRQLHKPAPVAAAAAVVMMEAVATSFTSRCPTSSDDLGRCDYLGLIAHRPRGLCRPVT